MTPISTGYIPQFGLGALYQGFNAANADRLNEEEVLKAFLQNQKEQAEAPLNQIIKTWEAKQAQGKIDDPEYLSKVLEGYKGQMNSQIAAGRKGMGTVDSDIYFTNRDNMVKGKQSDLLYQYIDEQLGTNYQEPTPLEGSNGQMGFNFGSASNALKNPNLTEQQKQLILKDATSRGENPLQNFSKVRDALVNTPKHLQRMEEIAQSGTNMMNVQGLRNEGAINAARLRAQQIAKDPKETEVIAHALLVASGSIPATPEEFAAAQRLLETRTTMKVIERSAGQQQGINIAETQKQGQIVNTEPIAQQFIRNPGLLTGDNTRRNTLLENKNTGVLSDGKTFKIEKTE